MTAIDMDGAAPPRPMRSPVARAQKLLEERDAIGRPLVFVAATATASGPVHVVGPDEDQPGYATVVDWLLTRTHRVVCGPVIHQTPLDGYLGVFEDSRVCRNCLAAFNRLGEDAGAAIFADNTEAVQASAPAEVYRIQRGKADQLEERAARQ